MPSVYDLKPRFQSLLRPLVTRMARGGVTANQVTIGACAMSGLAGLVLLIGREAVRPLLLLPMVLLLRMALNAVDGMLAREHGMASDLGALLNELGDGVSDALLYLPLAWMPGMGGAWIVWIVVLSLITEVAGLASLHIGGGRRYEGPMGKSDRALVFGAAGLLLGLGLPLKPALPFIWAAVTALLVRTVYNRCQSALAARKEGAS